MGVVADGLVLYFDAINNTGTGAHDNAAVVWKDISGNGNDGVINGATWHDMFLSFDGSNDWINCGRQNFANITIEVLLKNNMTGNGSISGNWQGGGYGIEVWDGMYDMDAYIGGTWVYARGSKPVVGEIIMLTGVYDGSAVLLYENGELVASTSKSGSIQAPSNNTVFSLGSNPDGSSIGGSLLSGCVYSARLYNRALTSDEIKANYEYDRRRYLPIKKFLVESDGVYYRVQGEEVTELAVMELTAEIFRTEGSDSVPAGSVLLTMSAPKVFCWTDGENPVNMRCKIEATPYPQILYSPVYDMTDPTILGIEKVITEASEDVTFAVSFDGGVTWKYYTGTEWATLSEDTSGMSAEAIMAVPTDKWAEAATTGTFQIRATLPTVESTLSSFTVDYLNA